MTLQVLSYDRESAVAYARKWAYARNPKYYNFDRLGGDCTNFASQCIFAGAPQMNGTPVFGWYYCSLNDRTPAWTGVQYLYQFLVGNEGIGPFGEEVDLNKLKVGDVVQFGRMTNDFYHSPVVVGFRRGEILVATHSNDAYNRPLSSYTFEKIRGIHILGYRAPDGNM
ncbi:MAG: amidase domain-containing protein [Clostridia bacterium]|nr:amidase domain-containing protein [Clostridia bacterium]